MNKKKWMNLLLILVGNFIYTLSVKLFLLPAELMSCGTTGIALIVNHLTNIPISGFILVFNVAMLGIPGEPFSGVGIALKQAPGWAMVLPTCITNGATGYFPMQDAYDEGGYEARSSNFKAGVAERLMETGIKLTKKVR